MLTKKEIEIVEQAIKDYEFLSTYINGVLTIHKDDLNEICNMLKKVPDISIWNMSIDEEYIDFTYKHFDASIYKSNNTYRLSDYRIYVPGYDNVFEDYCSTMSYIREIHNSKSNNQLYGSLLETMAEGMKRAGYYNTIYEKLLDVVGELK